MKLIISCGSGKIETPQAVPAHDLYTGPLWSSFRVAIKRSSFKLADVYVLSAEHGLIPASTMLVSYNRQVVPSSRRHLEAHQIKSSQLAQKLPAPIEDELVWFVGGKAYEEALSTAGYEAIKLDTHYLFPNKNARGGNGKQRQALSWFLETY